MISSLLALLLVAQAPALPGPLLELASAKRKDGTPALGPQQQAFLAKLPERIQKALAGAVEGGLLGSGEQLSNLLSLELPPAAYEMIAGDNCILCHTDPGNVKPRTLFSPDPAKQGSNPLLDLKELVADVHFKRGLSCAGCHGGKPTDELMPDEVARRWPAAGARHQDRSWIPAFCARCHSDPNFMRAFNPTLPTDQLAKYKDSKHGQVLLEKKDSRAAQCVSCHGVHGIRNAKARASMVHVQRIPETCGACHADPKRMAGFTKEDGTPLPTTQLAEYKASVHGKALEKGDLGAPACNACHGNHAAMPPAVAAVSQVCRRCHVQNGALFDGSRHKQVFGEHRWPECGQCHDHHKILKPSEALFEDHPGALCFDCHARHAQKNPTCQATANHFHQVIGGLSQARRGLEPWVERLAEKGLDVEPLGRSLGEADEALRSARTSIHRFDAAAFDEAARPALEAVKRAEGQVAEANAEHRFRTQGLLGAMGFMSLLVIGLVLKLRALDKQRAGEEGGRKQP